MEPRRARLLPIALVLASIVCAAAGQPPDGPPAGLLLEGAGPVSFPHTLSDKTGVSWPITQYGAVSQGSARLYNYGLRMRLGGSYISFNSAGTVNRAGDEVQLGPVQHSGLRVWRRVKVFRDRPMARWLDIFHNATGNPITVEVQEKTSFYGGISRKLSNSGVDGFGADDFAFVTFPSSGNNTPLLLHVVCGPKGGLQPSIRFSSSYMYVSYNLSVPAGGTAALCSFESHARDVEEHKKAMRTFRAYPLLKDLPAQARKLVVNFQVRSGFFDVEMERSGDADSVVLQDGAPLFGQVTNSEFLLESAFGPIRLPAMDIIGMAVSEDGMARVVLGDGQLVCGRAGTGKVHVKLPAGGELKIPLERVRQWSYRVSRQRPEEIGFRGPYILLRTGDRLAFDPASMELTLRTRHGLVKLLARQLAEIQLDRGEHGVHRVVFRNGSTLGGFLQPDRLIATLRLGSKLDVARDLAARLQFLPEPAPTKGLTRVTLTNGDVLFGQLDEAGFEIATDFGIAAVKPQHIRTVQFPRGPGVQAVVRLWDRTVLRGRLGSRRIGFLLLPGPRLDLHVGQCVSIVRGQSAPPTTIQSRTMALVAKLADRDYKVRETATEDLINMGQAIVPLLTEQLRGAADAEVRTRLEDILEKLTGKRPEALEANEGERG